MGFAELAALPLTELVAADWAEALAPVEAELRRVLRFLAAEVAAGHQVLPSPSNVLRAFRQPLADVRVLIVGQDPYPTPGHAVGPVLLRGRRHPADPPQPGQHLQGTRVRSRLSRRASTGT